jgi:hypothetical protein
VRHREEKYFLSAITVYIVLVLHLEVRNWKDEINKTAFIEHSKILTRPFAINTALFMFISRYLLSNELIL